MIFFRRLPAWAESVMKTKRISPERLSEILEDTAESRIQPTPRLAFIRHKVETLSLLDAVVVHIEQASNSTFKVIKGFPSVGIKSDSDLCTIRGGRSRGENAFGRLQTYAALLIEDDSGNCFYLTLDAIGDLRFLGWMAEFVLVVELTPVACAELSFFTARLSRAGFSKTGFSKTGYGFSETSISRVRFFGSGKKKRVPSCRACSHLSYST
jgi:hypothetical protein